MVWRYDEAYGTWWDDEPLHTKLMAEFGYPVTPPPGPVDGDQAKPHPTPYPRFKTVQDTVTMPGEYDTDGWMYMGNTTDGEEVWRSPADVTETVGINPPPDGHPDLATTANEEDHTNPWAYAGEEADAPVDAGRKP